MHDAWTRQARYGVSGWSRCFSSRPSERQDLKPWQGGTVRKVVGILPLGSGLGKLARRSKGTPRSRALHPGSSFARSLAKEWYDKAHEREMNGAPSIASIV